MSELGVLQLKYRPKSFDEMFGNEGLIESLKSMLSRDQKDIPHAFLLTGSYGSGKSTLARIIAKELGCTENNIVEMNIANNTGVDDMRKLLSSTKYTPLSLSSENKVRVYILDEFARATAAAQECLLKPLEEPHPFNFFILATTDPQKVIKTIKSRCVVLEVNPLNEKQTKELIKKVCDAEECDVWKSVIDKIYEVSNGVPRDILKMLDMVVDLEDEKLALQAIVGNDEEHEAIEIARILAGRDKNKWNAIQKLLKELKTDPERSRITILSYFSAIMMNPKSNVQYVEYAFRIMSCFKEPYYNGTAKARFIMSVYEACGV